MQSVRGPRSPLPTQPPRPLRDVRFFTNAFHMQSVAFTRVRRCFATRGSGRSQEERCREFYRRFIAANLFRNSPQRAKYLTPRFRVALPPFPHVLRRRRNDSLSYVQTRFIDNKFLEYLAIARIARKRSSFPFFPRSATLSLVKFLRAIKEP